MPAPTSTPKLAYIAVMLVAAGCLLLYLVRANSRPGAPTGAGEPQVTASRAAPSADSVLPKGDAAALRAAITKGMDVNQRLSAAPYEAMAPLHVAVIRPIPGGVAALVEARAELDVAGRDGQTPLMLAAERGNTEDVAELIRAGATVDLRDGRGRTALMLAAAAGQPLAVQALLRAGADVKATDSLGVTAFAHAAGRPGSIPVLSMLLAAGADPELPDAQGVTALMRAAEHAEADQVVLLLNSGASPGGKSRDGRSALDRAKARTDESGREVAAVLDQAGS